MRVPAKSLSMPVLSQDDVQPKAMPDSKDLLTFRQVVEAMRRAGVPLCGYTIRKRISDGTLRAIKTPYRLLVPRDALQEFIQDVKKST